MVRRVIARVRHRRLFDEQFWPVGVAMLTLCGFALGTQTAYLATDDPRWYANAWTWFFATIAATAGVLVVLRFQTRKLRPAVQISAILCLVVHVALFVISVETNILGRFWEELVSAQQDLEERELLVEPDYQAFHTEQEQQQQEQGWRQPVAVETPDSQAIFDREQSATRVMSQPASLETPIELSEVTPSQIEKQEMEQTVPKYSEQRTPISRAEAMRKPEGPPRVDEPIRAAQQAQPMDASTEIRRLATRPRGAEAPRVTAETEPSHLADRLARREAAQPAPTPPSSRLARQMTAMHDLEPAFIQPAPAPLAGPTKPEAAVPDASLKLARRETPSFAAATGEPEQVAHPHAIEFRGQRATGDDQPQPTLPDSQVTASVRKRSPSLSQPISPLRVDVPGPVNASPAASSSHESVVADGRPARQSESRQARVASARTPADHLNPAPDVAVPRVAASLPRQGRSSSPAAVTTSDGSAARRRVPGQFSVDTNVPLDSLAADSKNSRSALGTSRQQGQDSSTNQSTPRGLSRGSVDVPSIEGPGGLQSGIEVDPGIPSLRASRDSPHIQPQATRFRRRTSSGPPQPETAIVIAAEPFRQRGDRLRSAPRASDEMGSQNEQAIELGLAFLARHQLPNGSWSLRSVDSQASLASETAATGLALLAFQGAGYNHREHQYAKVVGEGIDFLKRHQLDNGDLFKPLDDDSNRSVWLYSHGIAALAFTEAYGMTLDAELRDSAQRAVDFIVNAQDRTGGGWRYSPGISSDTSVSGWMLMALKSARLAQLEVPDESFELARQWFDTAQASESESHLYRYNPFAPDTDAQRHGRRPSRTMTSVGLLARLYDGWRREDPAMIRGAEYLKDNLPGMGTPTAPLRDTYYWYYGTQVMFHMQGPYWQAWRDALRPLLVEAQLKHGSLAGSWNPRGAVADRWAYHAGRLYVTTLNLLSLEVEYRHLPIYEETAR